MDCERVQEAVDDDVIHEELINLSQVLVPRSRMPDNDQAL